jgi:putative transposase
MCCHKSCEALAAPAGGELPAQHLPVNERRACRVARFPVSTFRYDSRLEARTALRLRIREIAQVLVRYGYRKIRVLLNREGWKVGKKLGYRLYREEGVTLRHKPRRRRRASLHRRDRIRPTPPNQVRSLDFVADQFGGWTTVPSLDDHGRSWMCSRGKVSPSKWVKD